MRIEHMVVTRVLPATATRGQRVQAMLLGSRGSASRVVVPYDYELSVDGNHKRAAAALGPKLGCKYGIRLRKLGEARRGYYYTLACRVG